MTDDTKAGPLAGPNGDKLNWRETNGVVTTDSQADGTDVSENQDGAESGTASEASRRTGTQDEDATEGGLMRDGVAPDQRNADDIERSHKVRGADSPDAGTTTGS